MSSMQTYFISVCKQGTEEYEVHHESCEHLPGILYRELLGVFYTPIEAIAVAKAKYQKVKKCTHCFSNSEKPKLVKHV